MSALPLKADITESRCHVRFVPLSDVSRKKRQDKFLDVRYLRLRGRLIGTALGMKRRRGVF